MTTTTTRFTPTGPADLAREWAELQDDGHEPTGPVGWQDWQARRIAADLWPLAIIAKLANAGEGVTC